MPEKVKELVNSRRIAWKKHALKRLFERNVKRDYVFEALLNSEIIEQHE